MVPHPISCFEYLTYKLEFSLVALAPKSFPLI
uniref:Uncharacterized protein n=1 Tax=Heterorhabditis bacteriophora TaxID=37862 RepID=A0A1I7WF61_HETBA